MSLLFLNITSSRVTRGVHTLGKIRGVGITFTEHRGWGAYRDLARHFHAARQKHAPCVEMSQNLLANTTVQYQRSESDGQISVTGGSDQSDGKNFYRQRNVGQVGKHNITMH